MKDLQTQLTAMINAQIQRSLQTYITQATDQALAKILGSQPEPKATWSKAKATPIIKAKPPRRPSRRLSAGNNALVSLVSYVGGVGPMKFKAGKRNAKVWAFIKNVLRDGHEVPRVVLTKDAAAVCGSNYACISRDISVFLEKRMLTTRPNPKK